METGTARSPDDADGTAGNGRPRGKNSDADTTNGGDKSNDEGCSEEGEREEQEEPDAEWESQLVELFACPLTIRFTQDKVHPFFFRRGPIVKVVPKIRAVALGADSGDEGAVELVPPFPPIQCLRKGDELWSLDNRRLYALQLAAIGQWPRRCRIRILAADSLPRRKLKTQWRKFQSTSSGRIINVCARYQQFDCWSWFDRAVEIESYTLSERLGKVLSAFEMLPVVGAFLFRTGITGYTSRAPMIIAFILAFLVDMLRQKVPSFENKICQLHVKAVMDGDVREISGLMSYFRRSENVPVDSDCTLSVPQLSAMMALIVLLLLPYVVGVPVDKLRSSLLSCWLGVACVLAVQLFSALRSADSLISEYTGSGQDLTPKHRDQISRDDSSVSRQNSGMSRQDSSVSQEDSAGAREDSSAGAREDSAQ